MEQPIIYDALYANNALKIQKWWRKYTCIIKLRIVHKHLIDSLPIDDLQDLSNKMNAIANACQGDGAGLAGGTLTDMLISCFFQTKLPGYSEYHNGESDMKICNIPLSQKKINGKSTVALDWSKNEKTSDRQQFTSDIMIINLKTEQWWKKSPNKLLCNQKLSYNDTIPSGIYFVDKLFCKRYITLSCNNKTNTLITDQYLYTMLKRSIHQQLFISLPVPNKKLRFTILHAFLE